MMASSHQAAGKLVCDAHSSPLPGCSTFQALPLEIAALVLFLHPLGIAAMPLRRQLQALPVEGHPALLHLLTNAGQKALILSDAVSGQCLAMCAQAAAHAAVPGLYINVSDCSRQPAGVRRRWTQTSQAGLFQSTVERCCSSNHTHLMSQAQCASASPMRCSNPFQRLASFSHLVSLKLRFSCGNMVQLAAACLTSLSQLRRFGIVMAHDAADTAAATALISAVSQMPQLQALQLPALLTDETASAIQPAFAAQLGWQLTAACSSLQVIALSTSGTAHSSAVMANMLLSVAHLRRLTQLQATFACHDGCAAAPLHALQAFAQLRDLRISHISSADAALLAEVAKAVAAAPRLTKLSIEGSAPFGLSIAGSFEELLQSILQLQHLQKLALCGVLHEVSCDSVLNTACELPSLQDLQLPGNSLLGSDCIARLCSGPAWTQARVDGRMRTLRKLDLSHCCLGLEPDPEWPAQVAAMVKLTELKLECNMFANESGGTLAHAISSLSVLERLDLGHIILGSSGAVQLASALAQLSLLSCLVLHTERACEDIADRLRAVRALVSALPRLASTLQYLDLRAWGMGRMRGSRLPHLMAQLAQLTRLTTLRLASNDLRSRASAIGPLLHAASKLQVLELRSNGMRAADVRSLVPMLVAHRALRCADMHENALSEETLAELSPADKPLQYLCFSSASYAVAAL